MAFIALATASLGLAACSDEEDAEATPTEAVATATEAATQEVAATPTATEEAAHEDAEASAGALVAALRLIDTAGFHGMDETLNGDTPAIDASWAGATSRAIAAAQAVAWPEELHAAVDLFVADAQALLEAIEADDAATAAPLAVAVHESQHALSNDAFAHLAGLSGSDDSPGAMLAALVYVDTAGFHGMDEALNGGSPAIEASWLGATRRALASAQVVAWGDLQPAADTFIGDATTLLAALEADDLEAAALAAVAVHESQHALSHDAYHALGELSAADDAAGARLAAIILIDSAGFHGIDDALAATPTIEAGWSGKVGNALTAARAVDWGEQQPAADAFIASASALLEAIDADDAAAAAVPAHDAHETQHALSHDVYGAVGGGHAH
ncbi:MAG: hypothetical protein AB7F65_00310 [Dehalococcoidia bacterium]